MKKAEVSNTDAHKLKRRKYESELRKLKIRLATCRIGSRRADFGLSSFLKAVTPQARGEPSRR